MADFPTDTIIDSDLMYEDMGEEFCEDCRNMMKSLYLSHSMADDLRQQGFTDTHIIDAAEGLRRKGFLRIIWHEDNDTYSIELTGKHVTEPD